MVRGYKGEIIKEEENGYNKYMRSLFRAYLSGTNQEFTNAINSERRDWIQGKLKADYYYLDLIELDRLTYNNLIEDESWIKKEAKQEQEKNYLALATQLMSKFASGNYGTGAGGSVGRDRNNNRDNHEKGPHTFLLWRYENPDNAATKEMRGTIMKWCSNDCYDKPMWCGHRVCTSKADYAEAMQKKRDQKGTSNGDGTSSDKNPNFSKYFIISLAALTSAEDYASLEYQLFQSKE